ncbi:MAG TPA: DUF6798 domain-containing protein [Kineosporiaceae bacterium]
MPTASGGRVGRVLAPFVTAATFAVVLGVLLQLRYGYLAGNDDHLVLSLQGLQWARPGFLVDDWFVRSAPQPHILFDGVTWFGARIGHLSGTYLAWWLLGLIVGGAATAVLARAWTPRGQLPAAAALAALLALGPNVALGTTTPALPIALPHELGGFLAYLTSALLLTRRPRAAALACVATSVVHVQIGALVAVVCVLAVVAVRWSARAWWWSTLAGAVVSGGVVVTVLRLRPVAAEPGDFVQICREVIPFHCDATTWSLGQLGSGFAVVLASLLTLVLVGRRTGLPVEAVPAEAVPAEAVPAEAVPAGTVPAAAEAAELAPAEVAAAEVAPAEVAVAEVAVAEVAVAEVAASPAEARSAALRTRTDGWLWTAVVLAPAVGLTVGVAANRFGVPTLGRLAQSTNVFRLAVLAVPLGAWGLIAGFARLTRVRRLLWLPPALAAGFGWLEPRDGSTALAAHGEWVVAVLAVAACAVLIALPSRLPAVVRALSTLAAGVVLVVAVCTVGTVHWRPFRPGFVSEPALWAMGRTIARDVPPGGVVAAPPSYSVIRLTSGRSLLVDCKAVPYGGAAWHDYRARLEALGGRGACSHGGAPFTNLPTAALLSAARRYGAGYLVLPSWDRRVPQVTSAGWRVLAMPTSQRGGIWLFAAPGAPSPVR